VTVLLYTQETKIDTRKKHGQQKNEKLAQLSSRLLVEFPERFQTSISHTTRAPRPRKVDGVSYQFVSIEPFQALQATDALADAAELYGNRCGTVRDQVSNGKTAIYERDSRGVVATAGLPGVMTVL
jgi:guanylate kinase